MHSTAAWAEYFRIHAIIIGLSNTSDVPAMMRLCDACSEVGLTPQSIDDVTAGFFGYDVEQARQSITALRESELRFTLLADCFEMARSACVVEPQFEPSLRRLAEALAITAEQREAIAWFVMACDPSHDSPWRNQLGEINLALRLIEQSGASTEAVTDRRAVALRSRGSYLAVIRMCREVS